MSPTRRPRRADMGARAHAMPVDMRADADAQHIHAQVNRIGGRREHRQGAKRGGKDFHGAVLFRVRTQTAGCRESSRQA